MRLTDTQELAIQAIISRYVGREEFDSYFIGMTCGRLLPNGFSIYVHNEYYAKHIEKNYAELLPHVVNQVLGVWPQDVQVLVKDHSKLPDALAPYLRPRNA